MHRVLLVDDDPLVLDGIRRSIGRSVNADIAMSGPEGLELLSNDNAYTAIISDMNMRGMNGIEFLEIAKHKSPNSARILLTGYADGVIVSDAVNRAEVFRFLEKPIASRDLLSCLEACIEEKNASKKGNTVKSGTDRSSRISAALECLNLDDEFSIRLQPRISVVSGSLSGAEALVRWNHPSLGAIAPGDFITLAEESSAIEKITLWVLRRACRAAVDFRVRRGTPLPLSVNLSPALLRNASIIGKVTNILENHKMVPSDLELEITEGQSVEPDADACEAIASWRREGFKVSIDDFGSAYATMEYLRELDVDCVKIDRSFVCQATKRARDEKILSFLVSLTRGLGMRTVVEGVEDLCQDRLVRKLGVDEIQGFFYAKPMDVETFFDWSKTSFSKTANSNHV